jgi:hypothetical protein
MQTRRTRECKQEGQGNANKKDKGMQTRNSDNRLKNVEGEQRQEMKRQHETTIREDRARNVRQDKKKIGRRPLQEEAGGTSGTYSVKTGQAAGRMIKTE